MALAEMIPLERLFNFKHVESEACQSYFIAQNLIRFSGIKMEVSISAPNALQVDKAIYRPRGNEDENEENKTEQTEYDLAEQCFCNTVFHNAQKRHKLI